MKTCVLVGSGGRGTNSYIEPITKSFADTVKMVGLYDTNHLRAEASARMASYDIPVFTDWDKMLKETKPDIAIVTSVDATHHKYIISALEAGCDVISEKPLTTDDEKLRAICEAEKRTGKKVTVTFNCRFMPPFMRLKELVKSGIIGDVFSVNYQWLLDTEHGASYFRRWHSEYKNSGSLLIHKSTHHFDILNWILESDPARVSAFGKRRYYGSENGESKGTHCHNCTDPQHCRFYSDELTGKRYNPKLFFACSELDGYTPDRCVYSDEIDIPDTVTLNIEYKNGVIATYSLTAHSPFEGVILVLNGSEGILEFESVAGSENCTGLCEYKIRIYDRFGQRVDYKLPHNLITQTMRDNEPLAKSMNLESGHGGSDSMLRYALLKGLESDPLGLMADLKAGAMSIGIGIAANKSMKENRLVSLDEILPEYGRKEE